MPRGEDCKHGLKKISVQGCYECTTTALQALALCNRLNCTPYQIILILRKKFKSNEAWKRAVAKAAKEEEALKAEMNTKSLSSQQIVFADKVKES